MQFTANETDSEKAIWALILKHLDSSLVDKISPATSSFFMTSDGLECSVRSFNGTLLASCYSESDRMGKRRWTIQVNEK